VLQYFSEGSGGYKKVKKMMHSSFICRGWMRLMRRAGGDYFFLKR